MNLGIIIFGPDVQDGFRSDDKAEFPVFIDVVQAGLIYIRLGNI
jgi:hypothetical protein